MFVCRLRNARWLFCVMLSSAVLYFALTDKISACCQLRIDEPVLMFLLPSRFIFWNSRARSEKLFSNKTTLRLIVRGKGNSKLPHPRLKDCKVAVDVQAEIPCLHLLTSEQLSFLSQSERTSNILPDFSCLKSLKKSRAESIGYQFSNNLQTQSDKSQNQFSRTIWHKFP